MTTKLESFQRGVESKIRARTREYCVEEMAKSDCRIKVFTIAAWVFVVFGFLAAGCGVRAMLEEQPWYSLKNLGDYGSYLQGSVASLWALSGVMFIYATLLAQRMQLMQQAAELQSQREQFQLQQDSIKQQSFESSFFQLLHFQNAIAENLHLKRRTIAPGMQAVEKDISGRVCFLTLAELLKKRFDEHTLTTAQGKDVTSALACYSAVYTEYQPVLGHYFRTLYQVLRFIADSDCSTEHKRRYSDLVRAQLSVQELLLLFYNCLSAQGETFKALVVEFGLLEHFDRKMLLDPSHAESYPPSAYQ
ncbi:MAG: putative phage abortive infection protein [Verrucomicrobiota bacterium]|jgi:hypothetical protein